MTSKIIEYGKDIVPEGFSIKLKGATTHKEALCSKEILLAMLIINRKLGYVAPAFKTLYNLLCKTYTITDEDILRHKWFMNSLKMEYFICKDYDLRRTYPTPSIIKSNNRELLVHEYQGLDTRRRVFNINILYKSRCGQKPWFPYKSHPDDENGEEQGKDEVCNRVLGYDYPGVWYMQDIMETFDEMYGVGYDNRTNWWF
jgi:hypothetical protein